MTLSSHVWNYGLMRKMNLSKCWFIPCLLSSVLRWWTQGETPSETVSPQCTGCGTSSPASDGSLHLLVNSVGVGQCSAAPSFSFPALCSKPNFHQPCCHHSALLRPSPHSPQLTATQLWRSSLGEALKGEDPGWRGNTAWCLSSFLHYYFKIDFHCFCL